MMHYMMSNLQIEQPRMSATVDEKMSPASIMGRCSVCGRRAELVKSKWSISETCPHCEHVLDLGNRR